MKTRFLAMVSHELRTPLTAVQLQLERLRIDAPERADHREVVRRMSLSSSRLASLIESLLEHTRIESGHLSIEPAEFDLVKLCTEVVHELEPQAQQRGLALTHHLEAGPGPLRSDPRMVRLILVNLVANAIKFTAKGGIHVRAAYTDGGFYRLSVKDTGPGIPPSLRVRIFEPFYQLEPLAQKHTPGVGLGLAISRELAAAIGATLGLESTVGEGSTFLLTLPPSIDQKSADGGAET
jgi:signal transduction histidine kinase